MREELSSYPAILEVIERYIDGCAGPDDEKIRSTFHTSAQLFGVFAGKTVVFPIEAWIDRVMGDPKPADDAKVTPPPTNSPAWWVESAEVRDNMARVIVVSRFSRRVVHRSDDAPSDRRGLEDRQQDLYVREEVASLSSRPAKCSSECVEATAFSWRCAKDCMSALTASRPWASTYA